MAKKSVMSLSGRAKLRRTVGRALVATTVLVGVWGASIGGSAACAFVIAQVPDPPDSDCLPPLPGANAPVPDEQQPTSRFHHPKHRDVYQHEDYRIRELHVYAGDNHGGQGVGRAEVALRRTSKKGTCAWWDGQRFQPGDCAQPRWHQMQTYQEGYFYYYRIPALRPSMKTKIREYTAFARATDRAGNVEQSFQDGRNVNTFEISKR